MDSKGNAALLTSTKKSEYNFNYGGCFPVAFGALFLLGCLAAYAIAVARGNVDPVLPLISDAAGSPPQNGIFGTLICGAGIFGAIFIIQRYMIVLEKNREQSKLVTTLNKCSILVGVISMLGITIITGYPVNFYRNRDIWLKDVGLPHMVGLIMFAALGLIYIGLQCMLTLFVKNEKNQLSSLPLRVLLLFACTAAFVYHVITVPDHIGGISHLYYINSTDVEMNDTSLLPYPPTLGADLKLPIDTGGSYFTAAVTQWAFVVFFCCFFFTFYSEMQQYSLQIIVETHFSTTPETAEVHDDSKMDFRKASLIQRANSQVDGQPAPEVKKFLRRDSTCQTFDEPLKIITPTKNGKADASNGIKKLALDPEVDAKLSKILGEVDKPEKKTCSSGTQHEENNGEKPPKETESQEEERKAIEKIDAVVENAENNASNGTKSAKITESVEKVGDDEEKPSSCPFAVQ